MSGLAPGVQRHFLLIDLERGFTYTDPMIREFNVFKDFDFGHMALKAIVSMASRTNDFLSG